MSEEELMEMHSRALIQGSFITWLLGKDEAPFFAGVEDMTLPEYIEAKKQEYMAALETPYLTPLAYWLASALGPGVWAERTATVKEALDESPGILEHLLREWLSSVISKGSTYGWQAFTLIHGYNEGEFHDV